MVPLGAEVGHLYDSPNDGVIAESEFRTPLRRVPDSDSLSGTSASDCASTALRPRVGDATRGHAQRARAGVSAYRGTGEGRARPLPRRRFGAIMKAT